MSIDNAKNFAKVTVSTGYDDDDTSVVLSSGHGAKLPTVPFNAVWWNSTDYADPSDDPNVEIVRVTNIASDTLTVTRGQEGVSASTKNTATKTYKMIAGLTAKVINTDLQTTALTIIPQPVAPIEPGSANSISAVAITGNTTMFLGQIIIPFHVTANKISINVFTVGNDGTLDITLYSEDGQTQVFSVTTANIAAGGIVTTALSAVKIPPDIYYIAVNTNAADTSVSVYGWSTENDAGITDLLGSVTSEPRIQGTVTISANTPAATFTPSSSITETDDCTLVIRLDN